jgi:large subunit ribosomal protein L29
MKNEEIKALSADELNSRIQEEQESLNKLKFAHAVTQIENPNKIRQSRRLIARLKTELRAKDLNS